MKNIIFLALLLMLTTAGYTAPARHPAVKKSVHYGASAAKAATAASSVVTAPAAGLPAGSRPFPDVPKNHWAAAAVETLRQRGIVHGYPPSK